MQANYLSDYLLKLNNLKLLLQLPCLPYPLFHILPLHKEEVAVLAIMEQSAAYRGNIFRVIPCKEEEGSTRIVWVCHGRDEHRVLLTILLPLHGNSLLTYLYIRRELGQELLCQIVFSHSA